MKRAACTIISLNYLAYAKVLCESFLRVHPDQDFYVLLVDRLPEGHDLSLEKFQLVMVEELGIPSFESVAFKYDILELNTNVKPTFLKNLLGRGYNTVIYFDPDILITSELTPITDALTENAVILTPHAVSPVTEGHRETESILLASGVFNLGFVAVGNTVEGLRFLDWWEDRCLNLAYSDPRGFLFVDQKWVNLAPCFFNSVAILKHIGCNMAYWNLHERHLSLNDSCWIVNNSVPLIFFHFSGVSVIGSDRISKYTDKYTLSNRRDLHSIFENYRSMLKDAGIERLGSTKYAFDSFDNGQFINRLTRSLYAANTDRFSGDNPFCSSSMFYRWAKKQGIFSNQESAKSHSSKSLEIMDSRVRIVNHSLRMALRILGADRYTMLMKYLSYITLLRNQRKVFED